MATAMRALTVERAEYVKWSEGVLLEFHAGRGIAVNELACCEADAALERGEDVLLTSGGRLTGYALRLRGDVVTEISSESEFKGFEV